MNSLEKRVEQLQEMTEYIIEVAKKAGCDDVFVSGGYSQSQRIGYEKNDYNVGGTHESVGYSVTIHKDQKSGSASVNSQDKKVIADTIQTALHMAECSIPDEYLDMAPKSDYENVEPQYSDEVANLQSKDLSEAIQLLLDPVLKDERICVDTASTDHTLGSRVIANSRGMFASDYSSALSWSLMGMARQGDEISSFDYAGDFSYDAAGYDKKITDTSQKFNRKLLGCLGAKQCQSFKGKVLLPPSLVDELLIDPVIYHISGRNIMDGKSRWPKSIGEKIVHESLSLEDHPHDRRLRGCTAFSGEGVATRKMRILNNGILETQLDSIYSAKRRGVQATGNASGPHGAVLTPGKFALDTLKSGGHPFLELGRFSGNIDPISGDFSGVAKGSRYFDSKGGSFPVVEVMISGNIFDILLKNIDLSSELESDGGYYFLPWAMIEGVSVVGQ